jgi:two-component system response regulator MprA
VRILVVDDERAVRDGLDRVLRAEGYEVILAADGEAALDAHVSSAADAVLLDVAMPGIDGLEVCRRLRAAGDQVPVLMLTARGAIAERVSGLDAGADDYLLKPFAIDELRARLRALLRRTVEPGDAPLSFANLTLDPVSFEVFRGPRRLSLTRTEFQLLELFMRNPQQVLTRSLIFERVWGYDFASTSRSLDSYIVYVRRKLEAAGETRLIQTIRGVGYVLREEP